MLGTFDPEAKIACVARRFHSDKRSLFDRLIAPFDALYLRVLFGLVVMMKVVRHRPLEWASSLARPRRHIEEVAPLARTPLIARLMAASVNLVLDI